MNSFKYLNIRLKIIMKKFILLIAFVTLVSLVNGQKPITNDTIICVIDTTNAFTKVELNTVKNDLNFHGEIIIQGNYYGYDDFACIVLTTNFVNNSWVKGPLSFEIDIDKIEKLFPVATDKWINQQKDLWTIKKKIGSTPWHKYNYVIFKEDILNSKDDTVKAYRVLIQYNEILE